MSADAVSHRRPTQGYGGQIWPVLSRWVRLIPRSTASEHPDSSGNASVPQRRDVSNTPLLQNTRFPSGKSAGLGCSSPCARYPKNGCPELRRSSWHPLPRVVFPEPFATWKFGQRKHRRPNESTEGEAGLWALRNLICVCFYLINKEAFYSRKRRQGPIASLTAKSH